MPKNVIDNVHILIHRSKSYAGLTCGWKYSTNIIDKPNDEHNHDKDYDELDYNMDDDDVDTYNSDDDSQYNYNPELTIAGVNQDNKIRHSNIKMTKNNTLLHKTT